MSADTFHRIRGHTFLNPLLTPDSVVLDLGANRGEFARQLKLLIGGGAFYLVEANPTLAEKIKQQGEFPVLHCAVTAETGTITFHLSKNEEGSSILTLPEQSVWGSVLDTSIEVPSTTLEGILQHFELSSVDLLKLDIEGAEIDVLRSMSDSLLQRCGQVTVEFHSAPSFGFDIAAEVEQIIRRLRTCGFVCMDFSEGTRRDVLFINKAVHKISWLRRIMWWLRTHRPTWLTGLWKAVPPGVRRKLYRLVDRT